MEVISLFDRLKRKIEEAGKRSAERLARKAAEKAAYTVADKAKEKISEIKYKGTKEQGKGDPKEIAIRCYELLMKGDHDGWVKTLSLFLQEKANVNGSTASYWWKTGRHYIEDYGVYYEFYKEGETPFPNTRKFFFKRKNPDGSDRGLPVPCTVRIDDDGVWRVDQQSV